MSKYCAIAHGVHIPMYLHPNNEWSDYWFYVGDQKTKYWMEAEKWHNNTGLSIVLMSFADEVCEVLRT
jgi:hypothetical protein